MKNGPFFYWLFPVLLLSCTGNKNDQTISLAHHAIKGETWSVTLQRNEKISSTDSTGNTQLQEINMENVMLYTVDHVDSRGVATIRGKYLSIKSNGFDSGDSSTYQDTAMARMFGLLSQREFTLQVDTLGNVLKVTGAEGFYSMGMGTPAMQENKIMQENLQEALAIFPGKKVKKADSWEKTSMISCGYPGIYKNTYTLREVKNGLATIGVKTEVKPNVKAPPVYYPHNVMARMELYGTKTGTITVDMARGRIMSTDETLKLNGKANGAMDGKAFENVFSTEVNTRTKASFDKSVEYKKGWK